MGNFEELFNEIDTDQNGSISIREIMVFCKKKGLRLGFGEILTFVKYFDQVTRIQYFH
jgi:Ca2+-binding EF-hand superfamily protein